MSSKLPGSDPTASGGTAPVTSAPATSAPATATATAPKPVSPGPGSGDTSDQDKKAAAAAAKKAEDAEFMEALIQSLKAKYPKSYEDGDNPLKKEDKSKGAEDKKEDPKKDKGNGLAPSKDGSRNYRFKPEEEGSPTITVNLKANGSGSVKVDKWSDQAVDDFVNHIANDLKWGHCDLKEQSKKNPNGIPKEYMAKVKAKLAKEHPEIKVTVESIAPKVTKAKTAAPAAAIRAASGPASAPASAPKPAVVVPDALKPAVAAAKAAYQKAFKEVITRQPPTGAAGNYSEEQLEVARLFASDSRDRAFDTTAQSTSEGRDGLVKLLAAEPQAKEQILEISDRDALFDKLPAVPMPGVEHDAEPLSVEEAAQSAALDAYKEAFNESIKRDIKSDDGALELYDIKDAKEAGLSAAKIAYEAALTDRGCDVPEDEVIARNAMPEEGVAAALLKALINDDDEVLPEHFDADVDSKYGLKEEPASGLRHD